MADFKRKIGSWAVTLIESTVFGFVRKIKDNTIDFLEELPENASKAFYGFCILLFVILVGAAGVVILPSSLILIIVKNSGVDDKVLYAGKLFAIFGTFLIVVTVTLLLMIGKNIKAATEKATRKMVRKLEK